MPRRRSSSTKNDDATPAEDTSAQDEAKAKADAPASADAAEDAGEATPAEEPAATKAPAKKAPAKKAPAKKAPAKKTTSTAKKAPAKAPAPVPAHGKAQTHGGPLGPYGDDAGVLYQIFDSHGDFANAVGTTKIDEDDTTTLPDGGLCAFAIEDASGNRMGTVVSFQRQSGGGRHFDFDPGYNYWRFDRDPWGSTFVLRPLSGTVGLSFIDPHKWEITGAYPFNGGEGQGLPKGLGRGRVWRVSKVVGKKATAMDLYLWRVTGGPIKLQRWYGRPGSLTSAAWLALEAGEKLQFDAVDDPAKADGKSDFQTLILPEAP